MVDDEDPESVETDVPLAAHSARERTLRLVGGEAPASTAAGERELALKARAGDLDAFGDLVERRTPGLVGFLTRMMGDPEDARDVAQLTFVRAWERLERYDPAWAFSTWLYRIASNLAIDALRARRSRERTRVDAFRLLKSPSSTEPDAPSTLSRGEVRRVFEACAEALPETQRVVFILREVEEVETAEVARILGCRESTVRNHLFQARKVLREELRRRFPEYLPPFAAEEKP